MIFIAIAFVALYVTYKIWKVRRPTRMRIDPKSAPLVSVTPSTFARRDARRRTREGTL